MAQVPCIRTYYLELEVSYRHWWGRVILFLLHVLDINHDIRCIVDRISFKIVVTRTRNEFTKQVSFGRFFEVNSWEFCILPSFISNFIRINIQYTCGLWFHHLISKLTYRYEASFEPI